MDLQAFNISQNKVIRNEEVDNKRFDYYYWGKRNDYPQFLLDLKENSPIHSVACDMTVSMSYGEGVEIEGLGNVLINPTESLSTLYYKILYSFYLFGGYALEVIWNRDRTAIVGYYFIPFQNVRVGKMNVDDLYPETFYVCENWNDVRNNPVITYGNVNPENKEQRQMFYWTRYVPSNNKVYPVVPYQSGINSIILEGDIFSWHRKSLDSNLTPQLFVQMFGSPTPDERQKIKDQLVAAYTGEDGQKLMLGFASSPEEAAQITPIQSTVGDHYYVDILSYASQSVLTAWQIASPKLLSIHSFSSDAFSQNAEEIKVATQHMMNYSIKPKLRELNMGLEDVLSLKYNQPVTLINNFTKYWEEA